MNRAQVCAVERQHKQKKRKKNLICISQSREKEPRCVTNLSVLAYSLKPSSDSVLSSIGECEVWKQSYASPCSDHCIDVTCKLQKKRAIEIQFNTLCKGEIVLWLQTSFVKAQRRGSDLPLRGLWWVCPVDPRLKVFTQTPPTRLRHTDRQSYLTSEAPKRAFSSHESYSFSSFSPFCLWSVCVGWNDNRSVDCGIGIKMRDFV